MITAEIKVKRQKNGNIHHYTYYHCTGYRGKCELPYMREELLGERLGQILQDIYIPDDVLAQLQAGLTESQQRSDSDKKLQREKLQQRLSTIRHRLDQIYMDKLDGKISEDFWQRKSTEWQMEEQQVLMAMQGLEQASKDGLLTAKKCLETREQGVFSICYEESRRTSQTAENGTFELPHRWCKSLSYVQQAL